MEKPNSFEEISKSAHEAGVTGAVVSAILGTAGQGVNIAYDTPAPLLRYSKAIDGTYYVVEAIPDSKYKKVWVVSAYLSNKKSGVTQALSGAASENTSETSLASSPTNNTIPSTEKNVNNSNETQTKDAPKASLSVEAQTIRKQIEDSDLKGYFEVLKDPRPAISIGGMLEDTKALTLVRDMSEEILSSEDKKLKTIADRYRNKITEASKRVLESKGRARAQFNNARDKLSAEMVRDVYEGVDIEENINKFIYQKDSIEREMFNPSTERAEINSLINDKHIEMLNSGKYVELT